MDCAAPGSLVHGIFQVRILQWVATSFSKDRTFVSCLAHNSFPLSHPSRPLRGSRICLFRTLDNKDQNPRLCLLSPRSCIEVYSKNPWVYFTLTRFILYTYLPTKESMYYAIESKFSRNICKHFPLRNSYKCRTCISVIGKFIFKIIINVAIEDAMSNIWLKHNIWRIFCMF